jgi:hypothetical protein
MPSAPGTGPLGALALAAALAAALVTGACADRDAPRTPPPGPSPAPASPTSGTEAVAPTVAATPPLEGHAWHGVADASALPRLDGPSDKIRAVAFFKPT